MTLTPTNARAEQAQSRSEDPSGTPRDASSIDRRSAIVRWVDDTGYVSVTELADHFAVAEGSIRRDLVTLAAAGQIHRIRGGASVPPPSWATPEFARALKTNRREKRRIAAVAAEQLRPASSISFYSGSGVSFVPQAIPDDLRGGLSVVTNSLPILREVGLWANARLVAIGGAWIARSMSFAGPMAVSAIGGISTEDTVMGCDGVSAEGGVATMNQLEAEIGTLMMRQASRVIVVADAVKVGRKGFTTMAPASRIDILVTSADADPQEVAALRSCGVTVLLT